MSRIIFRYLASIAIFALLAASLMGRLSRTRLNMRHAEAIICLAIGAPLGVLTWKQSHHYADASTLYEATLQAQSWPAGFVTTTWRHPSCTDSTADLSDAIAHLQESLRIYPDDAEAHNNMGGVYQRLERYEEAIREHQEALRLNPQLVEARYNIGVCNQALNRLNDARAQYVEAIRAQPDYANGTLQPWHDADGTGRARSSRSGVQPDAAADAGICTGTRWTRLRAAAIGPDSRRGE